MHEEFPLKKLWRKISLGNHRRWWEDNIKMVLKEIVRYVWK